MRCPRMVLAPVLMAGVLTGCSGGEASPPRVEQPSLECGAAERSLYADDRPAPSIPAAMRPYLGGGKQLTILERFSGTAAVTIERPDGRIEIRAELVQAGGGWVRTSVVRCD